MDQADQQIPPVISQPLPQNPAPVPSSQHKSLTLAYVLGGMSFIPLLGVPLGLIAIVIGLIKKTKGPALLGLGGIVFSMLLYGSLFYFGFVAKTGPYAELRK